jgi:hypothetical protein
MTPERPEMDAPLFRRDDAVGELLRKGNAEFGHNVGQAEAQRRLEALLEKRAQRSPLVPALAIAAAVALAFVYAVGSSREAPKPPFETPLAVVPVTPDTKPVVTPLEIDSALAQGQTHLPDGSAVELADHSKAHWRRTKSGIHVELDAGEVRLAVNKQPSGQEFVVRAGSYRFIVLGTELSVRNTMYESHLQVFSGRVEVQKDEHTVAFVKGGEHWEGPNRAAGTEKSRAPAPREQRRAEELAPENIAPPAEDCTQLVKSQAFTPAAACYARQAEGTGLAAELALLELSRLRLSALGDADGAVRALAEHQRRFPAGVLTNQAQFAMVRALAAAGHHAEALSALEPLIARGGPKLAELRQLEAELRSAAARPPH